MGWDRRRYWTLVAVLALHLALLALVTVAPPPRGAAAPVPPVQLVVLPPARIPRVRSENFRPHRLNADAGISIAPPSLDYSAALAPHPSGSNGNGSGVDWEAEARRSLQAYEIRNTQRNAGNPNTGPPTEDSWWPEARHHAGDQFKTDNGDWIVWINSRCYQIAKSAPSLNVPGAMLPQTVCPDDSHTPRGDLFKELPAYRQSAP